MTILTDLNWYRGHSFLLLTCDTDRTRNHINFVIRFSITKEVNKIICDYQSNVKS